MTPRAGGVSSIQQIIDSTANSPVVQDTIRQLRGNRLRADMTKAQAGELLTDEEYAEKFDVGLNLKAKSGIEGISNMISRSAELLGDMMVGAGMNMANPDIVALGRGLSDTSRVASEISHRRAKEANEAFDQLQPDAALETAGWITEQTVANAPSFITALPVSKGAQTVVALKRLYDQKRAADALVTSGVQAFNQMVKSKGYYDKLAGVLVAGGSAGFGGGMEGLNTYNDVRMRLQDKGWSVNEAKEIAASQAVTSGLVAAALTAAFGTGKYGGIEEIMKDATLKSRFKDGVARYVRAWGGEAAEEGGHQLADSLLDKWVANPDKTLHEVANDTVLAAIGGGLFGGGAAVIADVYDRTIAGPAEQRAEEIRKKRDEEEWSQRRAKFGEQPVQSTMFGDEEGGSVARLKQQAVDAANERAALLGENPDANVIYPGLLSGVTSEDNRRALDATIKKFKAEMSEEEYAQWVEAINKEKEMTDPLEGWAHKKLRSEAIQILKLQRARKQSKAMDLAWGKPLPEAIELTAPEGDVQIGMFEKTEEQKLDDIRRRLVQKKEAQREETNKVARVLYALEKAPNTPEEFDAAVQKINGNVDSFEAAKLAATFYANADGIEILKGFRDRAEEAALREQERQNQTFENDEALMEQMGVAAVAAQKVQFFNEAIAAATMISENSKLGYTRIQPVPATEQIKATAKTVPADVAPNAINDIRRLESVPLVAQKHNLTKDQVRALAVVSNTPVFDSQLEWNTWLRPQPAPAAATAPTAPTAASEGQTISVSLQIMDAGLIPSDAPNTPDRPAIALKINGVPVAFYMSSRGTSGKVAGNWYPFFGIGAADWIIKGRVDAMERGYDIPEIKGAMNWLNENFQGTPEEVVEKLKSGLGLSALQGARMFADSVYKKGWDKTIGVDADGMLDQSTGVSERINSILQAVVAARKPSPSPAAPAAPVAPPATNPLTPSVPQATATATTATTTATEPKKRGKQRKNPQEWVAPDPAISEDDKAKLAQHIRDVRAANKPLSKTSIMRAFGWNVRNAAGDAKAALMIQMLVDAGVVSMPDKNASPAELMKMKLKGLNIIATPMDVWLGQFGTVASQVPQQTVSTETTVQAINEDVEKLTAQIASLSEQLADPELDPTMAQQIDAVIRSKQAEIEKLQSRAVEVAAKEAPAPQQVQAAPPSDAAKADYEKAMAELQRALQVDTDKKGGEPGAAGPVVRVLISAVSIGSAIYSILSGDPVGLALAATPGIDPKAAELMAKTVAFVGASVRYGFVRFGQISTKMFEMKMHDIKAMLVDAYRAVRDNPLYAAFKNKMDTDGQIAVFIRQHPDWTPTVLPSSTSEPETPEQIQARMEYAKNTKNTAWKGRKPVSEADRTKSIAEQLKWQKGDSGAYKQAALDTARKIIDASMRADKASQIEAGPSIAATYYWHVRHFGLQDWGDQSGFESFASNYYWHDTDLEGLAGIIAGRAIRPFASEQWEGERLYVGLVPDLSPKTDENKKGRIWIGIPKMIHMETDASGVFSSTPIPIDGLVTIIDPVKAPRSLRLPLTQPFAITKITDLWVDYVPAKTEAEKAAEEERWNRIKAEFEANRRAMQQQTPTPAAPDRAVAEIVTVKDPGDPRDKFEARVKANPLNELPRDLSPLDLTPPDTDRNKFAIDQEGLLFTVPIGSDGLPANEKSDIYRKELYRWWIASKSRMVPSINMRERRSPEAIRKAKHDFMWQFAGVNLGTDEEKAQRSKIKHVPKGFATRQAWANASGYGNSITLAAAIGRNYIKDAGLLMWAIDSFRRARIQAEDTRNAERSDAWREAYMASMEFAAMIQGATGSGPIGAILNLDPAYVPPFGASAAKKEFQWTFDWDALARESYEEMRQKVLQDPTQAAMNELKDAFAYDPNDFSGKIDFDPESWKLQMKYLAKRMEEKIATSVWKDRDFIAAKKPENEIIRNFIVEGIAQRFNNREDAQRAIEANKLSKHELAYFEVIWKALGPLVEKQVTPTMRKEALAAARAAGFKGGQVGPVAEETYAMGLYPKMIGDIPADSPIGDRLFRTVHIMPNGYRTVAVEVLRRAETPEEEAGGVNLLWDAIHEATERITGKQAKNRDHIVATVDHNFRGFYGWKKEITEEQKAMIYDSINRFPASEAVKITYKKTRPKIKYRGGKVEEVTPFFDEMDVLSLPFPVVQSVRASLDLFDKIEKNAAGEVLIRHFFKDMGQGGQAEGENWTRGWWDPKPRTTAEERDMEDRWRDVVVRRNPETGKMEEVAVSKIKLDMNDSFFGRAMLKLKSKAVFSAPEAEYLGRAKKEGAPDRILVTVQIPGYTLPVDVEWKPGMTQDAIYNRFIANLADAISTRLTQIAVREKMGVATKRTKVSTVEKRSKREAFGELEIGDRVVINYEGSLVDGRIVNVYKAADISAGVKAVGGQSRIVVKAGKVERNRYDVTFDKKDRDENGNVVTRKITVTSLSHAEVRRANPTAEERKESAAAKWSLIEQLNVHRLYGTQLHPEWFDGQPHGVDAQPIMGNITMKELYVYSAELVAVAEDEVKLFSSAIGARLWEQGGSSFISRLKELWIGMGGDPKQLMTWPKDFTKQQREDDAAGLYRTVDPYSEAELQKLTPQMQKMRIGKLMSMVVSKFRDVYSPIVAIWDVNSRIKAYTGRILLASVSPEEQARTLMLAPEYKKLYIDIKERVNKQPSQNPVISRYSLETYLPEKDAFHSRTVRLFDHNVDFTKPGLPTSPDAKDALFTHSLNRILVRVVVEGQSGGRGLDLELDKYGNEVTEKVVSARPVEAFMRVDSKNNRILIGYKNKDGKFKAAYWLDLDYLINAGVASVQPHKFEYEEEGQKKQTQVNVYYLNPQVIANASSHDASGNSLWNKVNPNQLQFLSIEDFVRMLQTRAGLPNPVAFTTDEGITEPAVQEPESDDVKWFLDELATMPGGKEVLNRLQTKSAQPNDYDYWGKPVVEDYDYGALHDVLRLYYGDLDKVDWNTEKNRSAVERIDSLLQRYLEGRVSGNRSMMNLTTQVPTASMVDPKLFDREFKGRDQIVEFLNDKGNGFTEEARKWAIALINRLPDAIVDSFTIRMTRSSSIRTGDQRVFYGGSFSHVLRIANLVAGGGDIRMIAEEIAHAATSFLPDSVVREIEAMRLEEIGKLQNSPDQSQSLKDFLSWLASRGGQATSEQMVATNRADWVRYYGLVNADEYFAFHLTEAVRRAESSPKMGKIREFFTGIVRRIISAVKQLMGDYGMARDMFFDQLIKDFEHGKFTVSLNGGYISEVNRYRDIASVFVATRPEQLEKLMDEKQWRTTEGRQAALTMLSGSYSTLNSIGQEIAASLEASGTPLSARTRRMVLLSNSEEMLDVGNVLGGLSPMGYEVAKTMLPTVEMRNQFAKMAAAGMHDIEVQANRIKHKLKTHRDYIASEEFKKLMARTEAKSEEVFNKEIIAKSVEQQIELAIKALTTIAATRATTQAEMLNAQAELRMMTRIRSFAPGIAQRMENIASDLARTPEGFALLESGVEVSPQDVERAWLATNPARETLPTPDPLSRDPANDMYRTAIILLARNIRLRGKFAAMAYDKEDEVRSNLPGYARMLLDAALKPNPGNALGRLTTINRRNFVAFEKAKHLWTVLNRRVNRDLKILASYDQADNYMNIMLNHPVWTHMRNQVRIDTGEKFIPLAWREVGLAQFGSSMTVPLPISNKKITVNMIEGSGVLWEEQVVKADKALAEIQAYMYGVNGMAGIDPNSADYSYWQGWVDALNSFIYAAQFNHVGRNELFGLKSINSLVIKLTGHIEGTLGMYPGRLSNWMKTTGRAWADSHQLMTGRWKANWQFKIQRSLRDAVRSHPEFLKGIPEGVAVMDWYSSIGREIATLLDEGSPVQVGEPLPISGAIPTKEDIEAVKIQSAAIDEAMSYDVVRGRTQFFMESVREDEFVPGYKHYRRNLKMTPNMLIKKWNFHALNFTAQYLEKLDDVDGGGQMQASLYANDFMTTAVLWFLAHRQAQWNSRTPLESSYAEAAEMIKDGRINTFLELLSFFDSEAAAMNAEAWGSQMFLDDFNGMLRRVHSVTKEMSNPKSDVDVRSRYKENSFTLGHKNAIAPGWWYDRGFKHDADIINFMVSGSSQYYNEFKRTVHEAIKVLENQLAIVDAQLQAESSRGKKTLGRTRAEHASIELSQRDKKMTTENMADMRGALENMLQEMNNLFSEGSRYFESELRAINRLTGSAVISVLVSIPWALRNMVQGGMVYNALRQTTLGRGIARVVGESSARLAINLSAFLATLAPAAVLNIPKIEARSAAKNIAKATLGWAPIKGLKTQGKWRPLESWLKATADIAPYLQGILDMSLYRAKTIRELERLGIGMNVNLRGMLYSYAESLSTGGAIVPNESGINSYMEMAKTFGKAFYGVADWHLMYLWKLIGRPGDLMQNVSIFNSTLGMVEAIEMQLRKNYGQKRERGVDPSEEIRNIIRQQNTLPPSILIPKFSLQRNSTTVNNIVDWTIKAGIDINKTILDFYEKLDATPKEQWGNIRWLSNDQATALAQEAVEDINVASPKNRPMKATENVVTRMIFALMGWPINMFSKINEWASASYSMGGVSRKAYKFLIILFIAMMSGAGEIPLEQITRWADYWMSNETRSSRQPWEASTPGDMAKEVVIDMSTGFPFYATLVQTFLNTGQYRKSFSPTLLVQNQIMNWINYWSGAWNAGDLRYGLDSIAKQALPISRMAINRLPDVSGKVEAMGVRRLLTRYGDSDLLRESKFSSGGNFGAFVTELTPYADRMVNAAMHEDWDEVGNLFEEAVAIAQQDGASREDAIKKVRQMYVSRNNYSRAYKAQLTPSQREQLLSKMTAGERMAVNEYERKYGEGARIIGANVRFVEDEGGQKTYSRGSSRVAQMLKARRARGRAAILRGKASSRLTGRIRRL